MRQAILDFSDYIADRTRDFVGREWVFAEIDAWLADPAAPRFFIITGEPGIGKTAIAARLTQIRELDAYHFCIARQADTTDPLSFVRSISRQLARIDGFAQGILQSSDTHIYVQQDIGQVHGQAIAVQIEQLMINAPSVVVAFNRIVSDPLQALYTDDFDRQIVILVDALDEATQLRGMESIVHLLASAQGLPPEVRFVLTSRPEGNVLRHFEQLSILCPLLDTSGANNHADVQAYVQYQINHSKLLRSRLTEESVETETFIERVTQASQGNFLYLVWLLQSVEEGTQRFDSLEALPEGLENIYREFLRRRKPGQDIPVWRKRYRPLLEILLVAQEPLSSEQLEAFTGLNRQTVRDILLDVQQFLDPIEFGKEHYKLYHQSIIDFLGNKSQAAEFWIDSASAHNRVVDYYLQTSPDHYAQSYLTYHMRQAGRAKELWELIQDKSWLKHQQEEDSTRRQTTIDLLNAFHTALEKFPLTRLPEVAALGLKGALLKDVTPTLSAEIIAGILWQQRDNLEGHRYLIEELPFSDRVAVYTALSRCSYRYNQTSDARNYLIEATNYLEHIDDTYKLEVLFADLISVIREFNDDHMIPLFLQHLQQIRQKLSDNPSSTSHEWMFTKRLELARLAGNDELGQLSIAVEWITTDLTITHRSLVQCVALVEQLKQEGLWVQGRDLLLRLWSSNLPHEDRMMMAATLFDPVSGELPEVVRQDLITFIGNIEASEQDPLIKLSLQAILSRATPTYELMNSLDTWVEHYTRHTKYMSSHVDMTLCNLVEILGLMGTPEQGINLLARPIWHWATWKQFIVRIFRFLLLIGYPPDILIDYCNDAYRNQQVHRFVIGHLVVGVVTALSELDYPISSEVSDKLWEALSRTSWEEGRFHTLCDLVEALGEAEKIPALVRATQEIPNLKGELAEVLKWNLLRNIAGELGMLGARDELRELLYKLAPNNAPSLVYKSHREKSSFLTALFEIGHAEEEIDYLRRCLTKHRAFPALGRLAQNCSMHGYFSIATKTRNDLKNYLDQPIACAVVASWLGEWDELYDTLRAAQEARTTFAEIILLNRLAQATAKIGDWRTSEEIISYLTEIKLPSMDELERSKKLLVYGNEAPPSVNPETFNQWLVTLVKAGKFNKAQQVYHIALRFLVGEHLVAFIRECIPVMGLQPMLVNALLEGLEQTIKESDLQLPEYIYLKIFRRCLQARCWEFAAKVLHMVLDSMGVRRYWLCKAGPLQAIVRIYGLLDKTDSHPTYNPESDEGMWTTMLQEWIEADTTSNSSLERFKINVVREIACRLFTSYEELKSLVQCALALYKMGDVVNANKIARWAYHSAKLTRDVSSLYIISDILAEAPKLSKLHKIATRSGELALNHTIQLAIDAERKRDAIRKSVEKNTPFPTSESKVILLPRLTHNISTWLLKHQVKKRTHLLSIDKLVKQGARALARLKHVEGLRELLTIAAMPAFHNWGQMMDEVILNFAPIAAPADLERMLSYIHQDLVFRQAETLLAVGRRYLELYDGKHYQWGQILQLIFNNCKESIDWYKDPLVVELCHFAGEAKDLSKLRNLLKHVRMTMRDSFYPWTAIAGVIEGFLIAGETLSAFEIALEMIEDFCEYEHYDELPTIVSALCAFNDEQVIDLLTKLLDCAKRSAIKSEKDVEGYSKALKKLTELGDPFNVVPRLTRQKEVLHQFRGIDILPKAKKGEIAESWAQAINEVDVWGMTSIPSHWSLLPYVDDLETLTSWLPTALTGKEREQPRSWKELDRLAMSLHRLIPGQIELESVTKRALNIGVEKGGNAAWRAVYLSIALWEESGVAETMMPLLWKAWRHWQNTLGSSWRSA